ncbi:MAG: carbon-nitrogen hydrolase family protein [Acidobacteria bacterium]|nr:carbon-nitrogen hydrolase family protein [Acidobacteriota bacterium]
MRFALLFGMTLAAGEAGFVAGALTLTPEPWNKAANFAKLDKYAREAAKKGAEVIVAPEGFLEGYVGNEKRTPGLNQEDYIRRAAEPLDGPLLGKVRALAKELGVFLMLGFAEKRGAGVYNSVVMFGPDGAIAHHYSKSHTMADEPFNTKGSEFPVMQSKHGTWGTLICFDRQLPETARLLALKGADTLFVPAWGSYGEMNDQMMRVRAYENGVNLVFVHPKRALLIDATGKILAQNQGEADQVVLARLSVDPKRKHSLFRYRRPELYEGIAAPATSRKPATH